MAGNMVTCGVTSKPTLLQIVPGVVIREKMNIELLHSLGITSSCDEVLRFKSSAAHAASKDIGKLGISSEMLELVQVLADSFDANIASANGIKSTHALALLVTQPQPDGQTTSQEEHKIRRLKKRQKCVRVQLMKFPPMNMKDQRNLLCQHALQVSLHYHLHSSPAKLAEKEKIFSSSQI